jgi:rhamnulokinase
MIEVHAAVDLGAGSGRVLAGGFSDRGVRLEEAHRFSYAPRRVAGHLRWDVARLLDGIRAGLRRAAAIAAEQGTTLRTVGVDSWAVDYGLIDVGGRLVEEPICYRDARTGGMMERAFASVTREMLFHSTGIQFLPFNTVFQLMAHVDEGLPKNAARLLMIPDLCHHVLCGSTAGEHTNASTTQLLNIGTAQWDDRLFEALRLPRRLMPELQPAGSDLGPLRAELRRELDLPSVTVVQPATHDTASAIAERRSSRAAHFVGHGSLVGVERAAAWRRRIAANFTNERGVHGTIRISQERRRSRSRAAVANGRRQYRRRSGRLTGAAAGEPAGLCFRTRRASSIRRACFES